MHTVPTTYKTFKEKLRPTPAQERALEDVLWRCRELYNAALEQRITAWQRRRVSLSRYEQEAEFKDLAPSFLTTPPSTRTSSKTCWRGWTRPIRRSFARASVARKRASRASKGAIGFTPSLSRSTVTARGWTMASWFLPRSGASACIGPVPSRARPRRSRSPKRRTAGMWPSRAPMCQ